MILRVRIGGLRFDFWFEHHFLFLPHQIWITALHKERRPAYSDNFSMDIQIQTETPSWFTLLSACVRLMSGSVAQYYNFFNSTGHLVILFSGFPKPVACWSGGS